MYNELTFDSILKRMLDRVSSKYDKREGSVIWDALSPASIEFHNLYVLFEALLNEMFADTATRKFLIKHCADRGITPKPASYATLIGHFEPEELNIPLGSRFSHEDLNYVVTERIKDGEYYLQCETIGSVANDVKGQLIPIGYINGLTKAEITGVGIVGEDDESTESLRARYFDSLRSEAFGGNEADYKQKIMSISGVGGVKVYSGAKWNGGGTVKCVIIDSDYTVAEPTLVDEVQKILDPETGYVEKDIDGDGEGDGVYEHEFGSSSGEGKGLAPIGHFVTVISANEDVIDIDTTLEYEDGHSWVTVKENVETVIGEYLNELNRNWASKTDGIRVRISQIESRILEVNGVLDVKDTKINGKKENHSVHEESIVTRGTINGN